MISETQEQEIDQVAGHGLLSFPDMQPVQVPKMRIITKVFFFISLAFFIVILIASMSAKGEDMFPMALVYGLLSGGIYYFSYAKRTEKKKNAVAESVTQDVNRRLGTAFVTDPRYVFSGTTHARDKKFKSVNLFFDSKKRKLLVLGHHGLLEDKPLAFVEDYDYIRSVHYSSKGGSTTSGVVGRGSVAIPFSFSTSNTNEITVLLRDPELVEVKAVVFGGDRHAEDRFQQLAALINP